ncbi:MAG: GAF domain-containing protein [Anaerolineales bacterium]
MLLALMVIGLAPRSSYAQGVLSSARPGDRNDAPARSAELQEPDGERRAVWILNSYHHGLSWTDDIVTVIDATLTGPESDVTDEVELYIDYMDTKRLPFDEAYARELYEMYREKYRDVAFEVIIVSDNYAYDFMRQYHDQLFPEAPVVFCGVNFFQPQDLEGHEMFTGVVEEVDIDATLEVALALHPQTEQIVVVNDATATGQLIQDEFERVRGLYEDQVEFVVYQGLSLGELRAELSELPENSLILLILFNRDGAGRFFTYEESIEHIYAATDRPIYGLWDFYIGYGLVGGMLANGPAQGEAGAKLAARILEGESVQSIPVMRESPNRYMFDYEQLERLGISIQALPGYNPNLPGFSVIINRPPTFAERFGPGLVIGTVVVMIFAGISALQFNNLHKQREIQAKLRESNLALEASREVLETRVAERTTELRRRSEQLEAAAVVARDAAAIRSIDQLMETMVNLISEQFDFYHAGIFLVDESREYAVLEAASSEGGKRMLERGHRLRVGEEANAQGIVGYVAMHGEPRIALDVGQDAVWFDNPDLPETRSEMGLPLMIRDEVIGVLNVQSKREAAFSDEDISVLQTMADQLALAIRNARLLTESQRALERLEMLYGERAQHAWREEVRARGYRYDGIVLSKLRGAGAARPVPAETPLEDVQENEAGQLVVPILLHDQVIGQIVLERAGADAAWTENEKALARTIGAQAGLALESARLLRASQAQAVQDRLLSDISGRVRETLDIDMMLQTAVREIGQVLDLAEVEVRLTGAE